MKNKKLIEHIAEILFHSERITRQEKEDFSALFSLEKIHADGSLRNFLRIRRGENPICIGVYPPETLSDGLAEARSAINIGTHLFNKGIPVPEIFGVDEDLGLIVFEDCGDVRLYDLLIKKHVNDRFAAEEIKLLYEDVVKTLALMQTRGAEDFELQWCYDTSIYDREVMVKKESHYFLNSFWYDFLNGEKSDGIEDEFEDIALHAITGMNGYFLHRDFQCRNIMITEQGVRIIDFQAGRLGPPGYDLASLLIDPYSNMTNLFREELLNKYLSALKSCRDFNEKIFYRQYSYLALQRNLQILGAFAFLYQKRCKPFFKDFIVPSLHMLRKALSESEMKSYSRLRGIVERAVKAIEGVI